ncbi:glycine oxidase ThiO [Bacillus sp. EAC]|uniref:glycine oxidase ThiO n=1 Tax=Bacillus sp. EAC TaxID=1978338 RepID=UPI000B441F78|nr:glycine oxidase ThiO [Bacillus sp. EAC]
MKKKFDVVVIGGGIIGCSIAYYLAEEKIDVAVLEGQQVGQKATKAAAGMLGAHSEWSHSKSFYTFARDSQQSYFQLHEELKELTGIDLELKKGGIFKLAYTDVEKYQLDSLITQTSAKWYERKEVANQIPDIHRDIIGAAYIEDDVNVVPYVACQAFSKGAQVHGATILEFTHVLGIQKKEKYFTIQTTNGHFEARTVVIASGVWSNSFFKQLGLNHQLFPVKGECLSVTTEKVILKHTLFHEQNYIVPRNNGKLVIGATMIENNWNEKPSLGGIEFLIQKAKRMLPAISDLKIEAFWAGLRPSTFDHNPFIGIHPEDDNILFATGHFRNGILLAPATGRLIKDLIIQKNVKTDWVEAFKINR